VFCGHPCPSELTRSDDPPAYFEWESVRGRWIRRRLSLGKAAQFWSEGDDHYDKRYNGFLHCVDICPLFIPDLEMKDTPEDHPLAHIKPWEDFPQAIPYKRTKKFTAKHLPVIPDPDLVLDFWTWIIPNARVINFEQLNRIHLFYGLRQNELACINDPDIPDLKNASFDKLTKMEKSLREWQDKEDAKLKAKNQPPKYYDPLGDSLLRLFYRGFMQFPPNELAMFHFDLDPQHPGPFPHPQNGPWLFELSTLLQQPARREGRSMRSPPRYILKGPDEGNDAMRIILDGAVNAMGCLRLLNEDAKRWPSPEDRRYKTLESIIATLVRCGLSLRTVRPLGTTIPPVDYKPVCALGTRPAGFIPTVDDFRAWIGLLKDFFKLPQSRAALLYGGIVWRIAYQFLPARLAWEGPTFGGDEANVTDWKLVNGYSLAEGLVWCDDFLPNEYIDLICGVHKIATSKSFLVFVLTCSRPYRMFIHR
jgi:hypothetical protein